MANHRKPEHLKTTAVAGCVLTPTLAKLKAKADREGKRMAHVVAEILETWGDGVEEVGMVKDERQIEISLSESEHTVGILTDENATRIWKKRV